MPWSYGRCMVWNFTRHKAPASSINCCLHCRRVDAEDRKRAKYKALCDKYCFTPVAVETLGALGEEAAIFFRNALASRDPFSFYCNV